MPDEKETTKKHPHAISGVITGSKPKRKRNTDIDPENKRDKPNSNSSEEEINESFPETAEATSLNMADTSSSSQNSKEGNQEDDFTIKFIRALSNETVRDLMTGMYEQAIDKKLQPVNEKLAKIDLNDITQNKRLDEVETRMDDMQQTQREKKIIITGLAEDDTNTEGIRRVLNSKLGIAMGTFDIHKVEKLPPTREGNLTRIRVEFVSKDTKYRIMKTKKQLKNDKSLWISDDLIPQRAKLAYEARMAVKKGDISQTWTFDSKIFIKCDPTSKPLKISKCVDIPKK